MVSGFSPPRRPHFSVPALRRRQMGTCVRDESPLAIAPPARYPGRRGDYTQAEHKVTLLCNKSRAPQFC